MTFQVLASPASKAMPQLSSEQNPVQKEELQAAPVEKSSNSQVDKVFQMTVTELASKKSNEAFAQLDKELQKAILVRKWQEALSSSTNYEELEILAAQADEIFQMMIPPHSREDTPAVVIAKLEVELKKAILAKKLQEALASSAAEKLLASQVDELLQMTIEETIPAIVQKGELQIAPAEKPIATPVAELVQMTAPEFWNEDAPATVQEDVVKAFRNQLQEALDSTSTGKSVASQVDEVFQKFESLKMQWTATCPFHSIIEDMILAKRPHTFSKERHQIEQMKKVLTLTKVLRLHNAETQTTKIFESAAAMKLVDLLEPMLLVASRKSDSVQYEKFDRNIIYYKGIASALVKEFCEFIPTRYGQRHYTNLIADLAAHFERSAKDDLPELLRAIQVPMAKYQNKIIKQDKEERFIAMLPLFHYSSRW